MMAYGVAIEHGCRNLETIGFCGSSLLSRSPYERGVMYGADRHLSLLLQGLAHIPSHKPLQRLFDGGIGDSITIGGHRG